MSVSPAGIGAMRSPNHFIHGYWSLQIKLPAGYSGGINFAWFVMDTISVTNKEPRHSEIDIEFYGNTTARNIMMALNVFAGGKHNLAQFKLPFDPSADFHTYAIQWNAYQIVWSLDGVPIRVLNYNPAEPWPKNAMIAQSSIWPTAFTTLKPNYGVNGGEISQYVKNYAEGGCPAKPFDVAAPGVDRCAGKWNLPLSNIQQASFAQLYGKTRLADYGWSVTR